MHPSCPMLANRACNLITTAHLPDATPAQGSRSACMALLFFLSMRSLRCAFAERCVACMALLAWRRYGYLLSFKSEECVIAMEDLKSH